MDTNANEKPTSAENLPVPDPEMEMVAKAVAWIDAQQYGGTTQFKMMDMWLSLKLKQMELTGDAS